MAFLRPISTRTRLVVLGAAFVAASCALLPDRTPLLPADDAVQRGAARGASFPPLDGGPFLVHLVHEYVVRSGDVAILRESLNGTVLVDRLRAAVSTMPLRPDRRVVHVEPGDRGINFGFDDSVVHTGDLLFASLLEFRAKYEFAELLDRLGHQEMAGKPGRGVKFTAEA